jgi:reverse gyrase
MSVYGNTCPMCCGDIDSDRAVIVCPSCGCSAESSASAARQPDAMASGGNAIMEFSQAQDVQIRTSAGTALQELSTG